MRRALALLALELSGASAIVLGISMVYVPAAFVTGGVFAVLAALALERSNPAE